MNEKSDIIFSNEDKLILAELAEMVIPKSDEYCIPGASDPKILNDILKDAIRQPDRLLKVIETVKTLTSEYTEIEFFDLNKGLQEKITNKFRDIYPDLAGAFANLVAQSFYRDDRIMRSLEIEVRPPYPQGYEVEQGDWSLLNAVRGREPFYR